VTEDDVPAAFRKCALDRMYFGFPEGELALSVPMAGTNDDARTSRRRRQFSWFRPVDFSTGVPRLCTDASGYCHGVSIPPPLIRRELINDMKVQAKSLLAPQIATLIAAADQPILQPIFDLESCPCRKLSRVARA